MLRIEMLIGCWVLQESLLGIGRVLLIILRPTDCLLLEPLPEFVDPLWRNVWNQLFDVSAMGAASLVVVNLVNMSGLKLALELSELFFEFRVVDFFLEADVGLLRGLFDLLMLHLEIVPVNETQLLSVINSIIDIVDQLAHLDRLLVIVDIFECFNVFNPFASGAVVLVLITILFVLVISLVLFS